MDESERVRLERWAYAYKTLGTAQRLLQLPVPSGKDESQRFGEAANEMRLAQLHASLIPDELDEQSRKDWTLIEAWLDEEQVPTDYERRREFSRAVASLATWFAVALAREREERTRG